MTEENLIIEQLENDFELQSDTDTGPMLKEKRGRGRPKGPAKEPKQNGRKIRSEKQIAAWSKMQKLNTERRAEKKAYKEEEMARIYMESKQKEPPTPTNEHIKKQVTHVPDSETDTDSDSSIELSTRQITQLMKAKLKKKLVPVPKKKKKPVYESSSSESESDTSDSDTGTSSSDSDNMIPRMKSRNKVYVERSVKPKAKVQQSFNSASYFV